MQVILEAMTRAEIRRSLRNLSASLSQAFQDTIQRIDDETPSRRQVAMRCLMWVSRARRPLSVEELRQALATEIGESHFDEDNLLQVKYIIDCCFGLIVIEEESSTVRLVHYTLQDYLQSRHQHRLVNDETEITKICLTYLCFRGVSVFFIGHLQPLELSLWVYKLTGSQGLDAVDDSDVSAVGHLKS